MTRTLTLKNCSQRNSTIIENDFIDNYMTKANGEYVKVYLMLLRHLNDDNSSLSISGLADYLECTEKDVLRAFKYWTKVGLIQMDYDEAGNICGLSVGKDTSNVEKKSAPIAMIKADAKPVEIKSPTTAKSSKEVSQKELRQLYFVVEQYIGKPLSASEIKKINYFYDTLHFSVDLIEYLIEYCVENGHRTFHYIESVALNWSDAGIHTIDAAKQRTIASAMKRLFPNHHPHELRYTFITRCKECGVNPEVVMLWDGHSFDKDVRTTEVDRGYTDYSEEYLRKEALKVDYQI